MLRASEASYLLLLLLFVALCTPGPRPPGSGLRRPKRLVHLARLGPNMTLCDLPIADCTVGCLTAHLEQSGDFAATIESFETPGDPCPICLARSPRLSVQEA